MHQLATNIPKARKLNFIIIYISFESLEKCRKKVELLLVINLCVETLIQPGRCQLSAPSMYKVKNGVQNMCTKLVFKTCMKCTYTEYRQQFLS